MKSRELRIGNLVTDEFYDSFKTIIEVYSINECGINLEIESDGNYCAKTWVEPYYRLDTLRPIPLTEEWLLKLGFYKNIKYNCFYHKDVSMKVELNDNIVRISGICEFGEARFVHEFQNLFFSRTGEELTINK